MQNCQLLTNFFWFWILAIFLVKSHQITVKQRKTVTFWRIFICFEFWYFSRIAEGIGKYIFTLRENTKIKGVKYSNLWNSGFIISILLFRIRVNLASMTCLLPFEFWREISKFAKNIPKSKNRETLFTF